MFRSAVTRVRAGYPFHRNAGGRREERTSGAKALSEGKGFIGAESAAPPKSEFSVNGKARVVLRACDGAAEAAAFRICAARIVLVRLRAMFQASLRDAVTFRAGHPALETPGYFRMSLRGKRLTPDLRLSRPAGARGRSLLFARAGRDAGDTCVRSVVSTFPFPPFAKCAKDGAPTGLFVTAKSNA